MSKIPRSDSRTRRFPPVRGTGRFLLYWHKRTLKYQLLVRLHGRTMSLGHYECLSCASIARNEWARTLFGDQGLLQAWWTFETRRRTNTIRRTRTREAILGEDAPLPPLDASVTDLIQQVLDDLPNEIDKMFKSEGDEK